MAEPASKAAAVRAVIEEVAVREGDLDEALRVVVRITFREAALRGALEQLRLGEGSLTDSDRERAIDLLERMLELPMFRDSG